MTRMKNRENLNLVHNSTQTSRKWKHSLLVGLIIFLVITLDQSLKIWVKLNMPIYDEFKVFGLRWLRIHFTENPGMAFGISLGNGWGKLALSLFRISAVLAIGYYLYKLVQNRAKKGLLICVALIWAGALGNLIDGALYGLLFSDSGTLHAPKIAGFLPPEGGYAPFLYGKVIDMLYLPIAEGTYPEWLPIWGGQHFRLFRPIFNIADTAITSGVVSILLGYRNFFRDLMLYPNSLNKSHYNNTDTFNDADPTSSKKKTLLEKLPNQDETT